MPPMVPRIAVVPHTHWDREWYEPFEGFRHRLVAALDLLLSTMLQDPSARCFLMDGQMAMVDDYLEVRPEMAGPLRALARAGRLDLGPWYVLADEFLPSPETHVRNLQLGLERAQEFGGAMPVGYLPDMFGHIAQMPQLLRLAGFQHAVVWRGVPSAIEATGFWWEAPDGSRVRAEYLPLGYSNGAALPQDPDGLARRVQALVEQMQPFLRGDLLLMAGTDHQPPQPSLGPLLTRFAAEHPDGPVLRMVTLPEYLAAAPVEDLPTWRGELRSGARANVLMGVLSTRVDVKQRAAEVARDLERRAEPLQALFSRHPERSASALALAWRQVVRNAAHDSICACSVDAVTQAVLQRYAEAQAVAQAVSAEALADLAASLAEPGPVVCNLAARDREGLVEAVLTGQEVPPHAQVLAEPAGVLGLPRGLGAITLDAGSVRTLLGMLPDTPRIDEDTWIHDVRITEGETGLEVTVTVGPEPRPEAPVAAARADLLARLQRRPELPVAIRLDQPPVHRVLARVGPVPGLGWAPLEPRAPAHPVTAEPAGSDGGARMTNGLLEIVVDPKNGTFSLNGQGGFGRLVDGGDLGDSYNYSPPAKDRLVEDPEAVEVTLEETGPLRARVRILAQYRWPEKVDGTSQARVGECSVSVSTLLELRADEAWCHVSTTFQNPCRDHRVRVHFPLPTPATSSLAECAFATVTRGLSAEGRPEELGLPTFPSRRFVQAGGLTVVHQGLHEYELVDRADQDGQEVARGLALTLLRATGMLSRVGMTTRPLPAGPLTPVPGLQMVGQTIQARYALSLADLDPYALADDVLLPLEVTSGLGGGTRPSRGQALCVRGAEISALRRIPTGIELRVYNPRPQPAQVTIPGRQGWLVDLRGQPQEPVSDAFPLRPFGIATVVLPES
jgi:mannosylglycerate hydrolase